MRLVGLLAIALLGIWFGLVDNDWLDRRPVERLLFLGHSYTYYNDMPFLVAKMADSAGSKVRYDVTMQAFPNASLEDHWKNEKSRSLLAQGNWNKVIVQPDTYNGRLDEGHSYFSYGRSLLAGAGKARPAIVISWTAEADTQYFQDTEANHRGLAYQTGADLIDVAQVWEDVRSSELPFSLYKDGNHPSLEGSYLAALVIYAALAHADGSDVTYVPWGMSSDHAALIRQRVQSSIRSRGGVG